MQQLELAGALLVLGGAISFLLGALSGFSLDRWMRANVGKARHKYRMIVHKEALWSSFLCFAIAGWVDVIPLPVELRVALAAAIILTGWGAIGQYHFVVRSGITDAYAQAAPRPVRLLGAAAMAGNLLALLLLLAGGTLALLNAI